MYIVVALILGSDDSQVQGEEVEYGYPITCGDSGAVLLFKKFVCPGINVRCVKVGLVTPQEQPSLTTNPKTIMAS